MLKTAKILRLGIDQGRIILTADKEFFKRIVKARAGEAGSGVDGLKISSILWRRTVTICGRSW